MLCAWGVGVGGVKVLLAYCKPLGASRQVSCFALMLGSARSLANAIDRVTALSLASRLALPPWGRVGMEVRRCERSATVRRPHPHPGASPRGGEEGR
ncbi:hypothetical protein ERY430_40724 [Erythrobacter sp. EC-HK427]|nr:hypothetical protein ERY430_40724 [Erythrobacter sp. EC-HK427]